MKAAWHHVQGPDIGQDHVWWFHQTFRLCEPGGRGTAKRTGRRSGRRALASDGTGRSNNNAGQFAADGYIRPHLLALALWGLGEVDDAHNAAKAAVGLLLGGRYTPGAFEDWEAEEAEAPPRPRGQSRLRDWRGDALRSKRRVYAALRDESRNRSLESHMTWMRDTAAMRPELERLKAGLLNGDPLPAVHNR